MDGIMQLDRTQKIAFARVVSDLIDADFIVEEREMDFFETLISKQGLNITVPMLVEAKKMDFAKAVALLTELDNAGRAHVLATLRQLALSDGSCVPLEAILILAVQQAMEHRATVYSMPAQGIGIENMTVIYMENEEATSAAEAVRRDYAALSTAFSEAGFDFVFIPFVVEDYRQLEADHLAKVVRYMIPSATEEKVADICQQLRSLTTTRFCRDLLYKRLNLPLLDAKPSLLIKLNESSIIDPYELEDAERTPYANFLRIELGDNISEQIRSLLDSYRSMVNSSIAATPVRRSHKFTYSGFHRALFDLIAYGREQQDYRLVIDLSSPRAALYFVPADGSSERLPLKLNPQETALYVMIVKKSFSGSGLDWRQHIPAKQESEILTEYNAIYRRIGKGNSAQKYKDRTQVHHIKNRIRALQGIANAELFVPRHIKNGIYSYYQISASNNYIQIIE